MSDKQELLRTALHGAHADAGGRLVDFAGWSMPLLYTSILDEHKACRTDACAFDVSHMGRLRIRGDGAWKLLDRACTADLVRQEDNTARYSLLCNEAGGILDDLFVLRLDDEWLVVCNASNRGKVVAQLQRLNEEGGFRATIDDQTLKTAMIAVQGPAAVEKLARVLPFDVTGVPRHGVMAGSYLMFKYVASRTGYTGEDGFEVVVPNLAAGMAWGFLTEKGGVRPAGLGARDVLRLEAGLPLYGHELNETIDPITAGLGRHAREQGDYVGAAAIAKVREKGPARKLVGVRLSGPRIARQGAVIFADGWEVGVVTSGTYSPQLQTAIAMAYVDRQFAGEGQALVAQARAGEDLEGQIVKLPFYRGSGYRKRGAEAG